MSALIGPRLPGTSEWAGRLAEAKEDERLSLLSVLALAKNLVAEERPRAHLTFYLERFRELLAEREAQREHVEACLRGPTSQTPRRILCALCNKAQPLEGDLCPDCAGAA